MASSKRRQHKTIRKTRKRKKSLRKDAVDFDILTKKEVLDSLESLHTCTKEAWKYLNTKRYKVVPTLKGTYKSDRWIWNGAMLFIFFWLWFIAHSYDYNLDYFQCGEGERLYEGPHQTCKNPFYDPSLKWKTYERLPYGEYGQKPGPLFNSASYVAIGVLILAGLTNHIIHNRRYGR